MLAQARVALDRGDVRAAQMMGQQALDLNVPDEAFGPGETRPWQVMLDIEKVARRREGVMQASGAEKPAEPRYPVAQGVYNPAADTTQVVPANSSQVRAAPTPAGAPGSGMRLYDEGLKALETQDRETALAKFSEAWKFQDQLDPAIRQQLKDKLTFLRAATAQPLPAVGEAPSPLEQVNSQQELLRQKLYREILAEEKAAKDLAQRDPRGALANLEKLRERVSGGGGRTGRQEATADDRRSDGQRTVELHRTEQGHDREPTSGTMRSGPASSAIRN